MEKNNQQCSFLITVKFKKHTLTYYEFTATEENGLNIVNLVESFYKDSEIKINYEYYEGK